MWSSSALAHNTDPGQFLGVGTNTNSFMVANISIHCPGDPVCTQYWPCRAFDRPASADPTPTPTPRGGRRRRHEVATCHAAWVKSTVYPINRRTTAFCRSSCNIMLPLRRRVSASDPTSKQVPKGTRDQFSAGDPAGCELRPTYGFWGRLLEPGRAGSRGRRTRSCTAAVGGAARRGHAQHRLPSSIRGQQTVVSATIRQPVDRCEHHRPTLE